MMEKRLVITASILGFLAVLLGAFAAHGLQAMLTDSQIASFQTGVRYQFYHVFLLLFVAHTDLISETVKNRIYWLVLLGIGCFSGSIYLLCVDEYAIGSNIKALVFITPLGGFLLLGAWLSLFIGVLKRKHKEG